MLWARVALSRRGVLSVRAWLGHCRGVSGRGQGRRSLEVPVLVVRDAVVPRSPEHPHPAGAEPAQRAVVLLLAGAALVVGVPRPG